MADLAGKTVVLTRGFRKPLPSGERLNLAMSPHLEMYFQVQGLPTSD